MPPGYSLNRGLAPRHECVDSVFASDRNRRHWAAIMLPGRCSDAHTASAALLAHDSFDQRRQRGRQACGRHARSMDVR